MDQGPFEQVKRITAELLADESQLPGLIAVLSKAATNDLMLVYVRQVRGRERAGRT
jgi:hypothetical protein